MSFPLVAVFLELAAVFDAIVTSPLCSSLFFFVEKCALPHLMSTIVSPRAPLPVPRLCLWHLPFCVHTGACQPHSLILFSDHNPQTGVLSGQPSNLGTSLLDIALG